MNDNDTSSGARTLNVHALADRWGVEPSEAAAIADLVPAMKGPDLAALLNLLASWDASVVEEAERVFPELRCGEALSVFRGLSEIIGGSQTLGMSTKYENRILAAVVREREAALSEDPGFWRCKVDGVPFGGDLTEGYTERTLLTLPDIARRWDVSKADAKTIIAAIPTLPGEGDFDHELADGSILWTWSEIDTVECAFPELLSGDGLEVAQRMRALAGAFEDLGSNAGDAPADLVYDKAAAHKAAAA